MIPLGWEIDRAVLPLQRFPAHRVYLLCDPSGHQKRQFYLRKVASKLKAQGVDVREVTVDTFMDLHGTMREVSRIVETELKQGARVHVNISASGRLAAIGAALAAMAHLVPGRGSIYYVPAAGYPTSRQSQLRHGMSRGMKRDPIELPLFEISLPNLPSRIILSQLFKSPSRKLNYGEIREALVNSGLPGFGSLTQGASTRREKTEWAVNLHRKAIRGLVRDKLVEIESHGKERSLSLTKSGEYVACLCRVSPNGTVR